MGFGTLAAAGVAVGGLGRWPACLALLTVAGLACTAALRLLIGDASGTAPTVDGTGDAATETTVGSTAEGAPAVDSTALAGTGDDANTGKLSLSAGVESRNVKYTPTAATETKATAPSIKNERFWLGERAPMVT